MKKLYLTLLLVLLSIIIYCQPTIYSPITNDVYDVNANEYNVNNTGNDMLVGNTVGWPLYVTVCDGDEPHFIWYKGGSNPQTINIEDDADKNATIIDPDVVLFESSDATYSTTYYAFVVFQTVGGDIDYVIKVLDLSDPNNLQWVQIDQDNLGSGTNPNIDASVPETSLYGDNKFAITWEDNGYIKGLVGDFLNGIIQNQSAVIEIYDPANYPYSNAETPDVTISYTPFSITYMVSFTFNIIDRLWVHQEDFDDIIGNTITSGNLVCLYEYPYSYGRPRIASPDIFHGGAAYGVYDYEIVVDAKDINNSYEEILGFNRHFSTNTPYQYEYNTTSPSWWEGLPVVCYHGDNIIISWVLNNVSGSTDKDIITIDCGNNGLHNNGYFSQVNMDDRGIQSIPSVSAQYTNYIFQSWMDFDTDHIKSKPCSPIDQQKKLINSDQNVLLEQNIYPNPANTSFNVLSFGEGTLKLFDIKGREVLKTSLEEYNNEINIDGIPPGVYQVKMSTMNLFETKKLIIY